MSILITIEKKAYRVYRISARRINKHDVTKVTNYNVLDSVPTFTIAIQEARKLARTWFGHTGKNKESIIDLHIKECSKKQNGKFIFEHGRFYRRA
jgi:hypothetical protein